jgi:hypothetical protein
MSDDLDTTYCSCNVEGRGVELTPEGIYICVLCGNQVFINKAWSPAFNNKHINTLTSKNHALNEGYHGRIRENKDDL